MSRGTLGRGAVSAIDMSVHEDPDPSFEANSLDGVGSAIVGISSWDQCGQRTAPSDSFVSCGPMWKRVLALFGVVGRCIFVVLPFVEVDSPQIYLSINRVFGTSSN